MLEADSGTKLSRFNFVNDYTGSFYFSTNLAPIHLLGTKLVYHSKNIYEVVSRYGNIFEA